MIVDFFVLLWILALAVPVYWAVGLTSVRLAILSLVSLAVLWSLSPVIPITLLVYGALIAAFAQAQKSGVSPAALRRASWGVFLPLAGLDFAPHEWIVQGLIGQGALNAPALVGFAFLGMSYTAIRAFIMIRERINSRGAGPLETAASLTFFGSFAAGPIAGGQPWLNPRTPLMWRDLMVGLSRIFWGSALLLAVKPLLVGLDMAELTGLPHDGRAVAWLGMYRDFLALYVDFTGYSDVAIGAGLLFGIKLPENFNWPLRSTSIQEFWQRWHMSLGAFIGMYLFKPFVRSVGKPSYAIFLAFSLVGLWHAVTLTYFLWGVGHGLALGITMRLRKRYGARIAAGPAIGRVVTKAFGWAFTLNYVAILSGFANSKDLVSGLDFVSRLL